MEDHEVLVIDTYGKTRRVSFIGSLKSLLAVIIGKHAEAVGNSENDAFTAYCSLPMHVLEKNMIGERVLALLGVHTESFSAEDLYGNIVIAGPNKAGLSSRQLSALEWLATYANAGGPGDHIEEDSGQWHDILWG